MNWRIVVSIGLIAVGIAAVGLTVFGPTFARNDTNEYLTAQASVTDVVDEAVADGTIGAATTYALAFGAEPQVAASSSADGGAGTWLVEKVNISVGQAVKAGDVLAEADATDAQASLELAQANLATAQARYDSDTGGVSSTDQQSAQLSVDQAQQNLAAAKQSRDETARQNQIRISQAEDDVSRAQSQLKQDRADNAPDSVIQQDKDALRTARDSLTLLRAEVAASNRQAQDQVDAAQLALDSAKNDYESRTGTVSAETLASDKAALLQAEQDVADARERVSDAVLRSPVDGVVVAVSLVPGTLAPASDAVRVMSNQMQVSADFAESDVPSIALGQDATVTVTATGDKLSGEVIEIDPIAASSGGDSVVSYTVTIDVQDVPEQVKSGMSAQAAITVARADDVVAVPSTALQGSAGSYSVRVLNADGSVTSRPVETGLVTTSLAEIKSGVAAGEQVVVGTTSSLTSSGNTFPGGFTTGGGAIQPGGGPRVITGP